MFKKCLLKITKKQGLRSPICWMILATNSDYGNYTCFIFNNLFANIMSWIDYEIFIISEYEKNKAQYS